MGAVSLTQLETGPVARSRGRSPFPVAEAGPVHQAVYWAGGRFRRCLLQVLATSPCIGLPVSLRVLLSANDGVLSIQQGSPDGPSLWQLGADD